MLGLMALVPLGMYVVSSSINFFTGNEVSGWISTGFAGAVVLIPGLVGYGHNAAMRYQTYKTRKEISMIEAADAQENESEDEEDSLTLRLSSDFESVHEVETTEFEDSSEKEQLRKQLQDQKEAFEQIISDRDQLLLNANKRNRELESELEKLRNTPRASSEMRYT